MAVENHGWFPLVISDLKVKANSSFICNKVRVKYRLLCNKVRVNNGNPCYEVSPIGAYLTTLRLSRSRGHTPWATGPGCIPRSFRIGCTPSHDLDALTPPFRMRMDAEATGSPSFVPESPNLELQKRFPVVFGMATELGLGVS